MAISAEEIRAYLLQNPDMSDAEIRAAAEQNGISLEALTNAITTDPERRWEGTTADQIAARWNNPQTLAGGSSPEQQRQEEIRNFLLERPYASDSQLFNALNQAGYADINEISAAMLSDPENRWAGTTQEELRKRWANPSTRGGDYSKTDGMGNTLPQYRPGYVPPGGATPTSPTSPTGTPTRADEIRNFLLGMPTQSDAQIKQALTAAGYNLNEVTQAMTTDPQNRWADQSAQTIAQRWGNPSTIPFPTTPPPAPAPTTPPATGGIPNYVLPPMAPRTGQDAAQFGTTAAPLDQARQLESKGLLGSIARGTTEFLEAMPQATAVMTDMTGTITPGQDIQQIQGPGAIDAPNAVQVPLATTAQGTTSTAQAPAPLTAPTMQTTDVGTMAPTQAATGQVSDQAIAAPVEQQTLSAGATAEAAQVTQADIDPGAEMVAAVGQMSPEALAEAATVAGFEAARVDQAKQQLRKAGLTEAEIAEYAGDPAALEARLSDFTEEQRGLIGGLPIEALVSTQMDALLQGIDNGEVPNWAKPALSAVEQMLARRGMSASSIGRDALMNAVIQSAMPLAQQNAQAIQNSIMQKREFMQQSATVEAQFRQQTALQNAQQVFALDMTNLNNEQQARLSNSQFLQTVSLTNVNNRQQAALQNAAQMAGLDIATLDANTKLAAQNAQAFLQMDMANLSNEQQAAMIDTQFEQQRLLTNAAAANAAAQFNAASQSQTDQFMASLGANIAQFNATQYNAMQQFNASESNRQSAINAGNTLQAEQFNAQLKSQVDQFNAATELQVQQWNAANWQAIEQSNVQWRRQANTANTAAQNAINQQNVQNAFGMTMQAQAALWQELRDQATFDMQAYENSQDREAQLYATAIGNESAAANNYDHTTHLINLARMFFGGNP